MKRSALAVLAAAGIVLTGCAASNDGTATAEPPAATEQVPVENTEPTETPEPTAEEMHAHPLGTRSEPLGAGEIAPLGGWDITLTDPVIDGSGEPVSEELPEDSSPAEGEVVATAEVELVNTGDPNVAADPNFDLVFTYVGASGTTYPADEWSFVDEMGWPTLGEMYGGASETGTAVSFVPADETGGVWKVEYWDPAGFEPVVAHFEG